PTSPHTTSKCDWSPDARSPHLQTYSPARSQAATQPPSQPSSPSSDPTRSSPSPQPQASNQHHPKQPCTTTTSHHQSPHSSDQPKDRKSVEYEKSVPLAATRNHK